VFGRLAAAERLRGLARDPFITGLAGFLADVNALHPFREGNGRAQRAFFSRIDTQFVGTPGQVADQLERLRDATEADELIITTITHDHADRVRSYQLLAEE
jgi:fido (protein-threonine AMPylation protein)